MINPGMTNALPIAHFRAFTLNVDQGRLHKNGDELALRPKSMALLVHLVRNADRLLSKDELLDAVWSGVNVTEDSLTQCIRDIRRALDDTDQRLIRTVPRRGYVFSSHAREPAGSEDPVLITADSFGAQRHGTPSKPSIAVLPFRNLGGNPEQEYFADGVAEEIISALSRVRSFFVIARNSSFTFRREDTDFAQIGREFGVQYVLDGSVRRSVNRLRITATLIDAVSGAHIWSERFQGEREDVFDLQDRITECVVGALEPTIRSAEIERARRKRPGSLDAYDLVMRALPSFWAMTREANADAISLLERAMSIDPRYAFATALYAWSCGMRAPYHWTADPAVAREMSLTFARVAARLDSEDPFVLAILGAAHSLSGHYDEAVPLIDASLAIDPNSAFAWQRKGWLQTSLNAPDQGIVCFQRAMRVSPLDAYNFNALLGIGCAHLLAQRFEDSLVMLLRGLAMRPSATWAWRSVVAAYVFLDRMDDARAALAKFRGAHPGITISRVAASMEGLNSNHRRMNLDGLRKAGLPE